MTGLKPDRQQARIDWMPGATAIDFAETSGCAAPRKMRGIASLMMSSLWASKNITVEMFHWLKTIAAVFGRIEG
jgi:hypothetical protein